MSRPAHFNKPSSPKAKFWTHCVKCGDTLIRVPDEGKAGGKLAHPVIENNRLVGWQDHCER